MPGHLWYCNLKKGAKNVNNHKNRYLNRILRILVCRSYQSRFSPGRIQSTWSFRADWISHL